MREVIDPLDDKYTTGLICPKTGNWMCKIHPAVTKFIREGATFPNCSSGAGHSTTWHYLEIVQDKKEA